MTRHGARCCRRAAALCRCRQRAARRGAGGRGPSRVRAAGGPLGVQVAGPRGARRRRAAVAAAAVVAAVAVPRRQQCRARWSCGCVSGACACACKGPARPRPLRCLCVTALFTLPGCPAYGAQSLVRTHTYAHAHTSCRCLPPVAIAEYQCSERMLHEHIKWLCDQAPRLQVRGVRWVHWNWRRVPCAMALHSAPRHTYATSSVASCMASHVSPRGNPHTHPLAPHVLPCPRRQRAPAWSTWKRTSRTCRWQRSLRAAAPPRTPTRCSCWARSRRCRSCPSRCTCWCVAGLRWCCAARGTLCAGATAPVALARLAHV